MERGGGEGSTATDSVLSGESRTNGTAASGLAAIMPSTAAASERRGFRGFAGDSALSFAAGERWQQSSLAAADAELRSQPALCSQHDRAARLRSLQYTAATGASIRAEARVSETARGDHTASLV
jgi:hypothetical protein